MRVPDEVRDWYSKIGRRGGLARDRALTPAQRQELGEHLARARAAKRAALRPSPGDVLGQIADQIGGTR